MSLAARVPFRRVPGWGIAHAATGLESIDARSLAEVLLSRYSSSSSLQEGKLAAAVACTWLSTAGNHGSQQASPALSPKRTPCISLPPSLYLRFSTALHAPCFVTAQRSRSNGRNSRHTWPCARTEQVVPTRLRLQPTQAGIQAQIHGKGSRRCHVVLDLLQSKARRACPFGMSRHVFAVPQSAWSD